MVFSRRIWTRCTKSSRWCWPQWFCCPSLYSQCQAGWRWKKWRRSWRRSCWYRCPRRPYEWRSSRWHRRHTCPLCPGFPRIVSKKRTCSRTSAALTSCSAPQCETWPLAIYERIPSCLVSRQAEGSDLGSRCRPLLACALADSLHSQPTPLSPWALARHAASSKWHGTLSDLAKCYRLSAAVFCLRWARWHYPARLCQIWWQFRQPHICCLQLSFWCRCWQCAVAGWVPLHRSSACSRRPPGPRLLCRSRNARARSSCTAGPEPTWSSCRRNKLSSSLVKIKIRPVCRCSRAWEHSCCVSSRVPPSQTPNTPSSTRRRPERTWLGTWTRTGWSSAPEVASPCFCSVRGSTTLHRWYPGIRTRRRETFANRPHHPGSSPRSSWLSGRWQTAARPSRSRRSWPLRGWWCQLSSTCLWIGAPVSLRQCSRWECRSCRSRWFSDCRPPPSSMAQCREFHGFWDELGQMYKLH